MIAGCGPSRRRRLIANGGTIGNGARYWRVCPKLTSRSAMPPRLLSSPAVESCRPGPSQDPSHRSARCDRQTVPDATVCIDAVSRPNHHPPQPANVLAETRGAGCPDQEAGAHRGSACGVEHFEKRPPSPGEHPALAPRDEFTAPPIHIRFGICQRDFGLAPLAENGRTATDVLCRTHDGRLRRH